MNIIREKVANITKNILDELLQDLTLDNIEELKRIFSNLDTENKG
jgi:hypothetical protein